jgi:hypothetical protein
MVSDLRETSCSDVFQSCWWLGMLQIGIRAKVQELSLDGPDKWSLEPRFQREIVSRGTNFEPRSIMSAKRLPWSCYESHEV